MKKSDIISLIQSHAEHNELAFKNTAYRIADYFRNAGDFALASFITNLMAEANGFVPQEDYCELKFLLRLEPKRSHLYLPNKLQQYLLGLINAIESGSGIHRIMFQGAPGTGKTESVKNIANIMRRDLYSVQFSNLIDSKLGQTQKNLAALFKEISIIPHPEKSIILFDEIDAIAMDRTNSQDLREMGRVTTALLKELDELDENIVVIATTNLYEKFDKALTRRFDIAVNFNTYTKEDIIDIGEKMCLEYISKTPNLGKDMRLLRKILAMMEPILAPADLKKAIKVSFAFCNRDRKLDYCRTLFLNLVDGSNQDCITLKNKGFTLREIEILTGISKSNVARELK